MDKHTEKKLELYYQTLQYINAKSQNIDNMAYGVIFTLATPLLIFIGFCVVEDKYKYFLVGLPFMSIAIIVVALNIEYHYSYIIMFRNYIENKINVLMNDKVAVQSVFIKEYFQKAHSFAKLPSCIGFIMLIIINVVLVDKINKLVAYIILNTTYRIVVVALEYYWHVVFIFFITVILIYFGCMYLLKRNMAKIFNDGNA